MSGAESREGTKNVSEVVDDRAPFDEEPANIGIARESHAKLQRLKEDGLFNEMADAYRFAVAFAVAKGGQTQDVRERQNLFHRGTVDTDKALYYAVAALKPDLSGSVYKEIERLASWGVNELDRRLSEKTVSFADLLKECARASGEPAGDAEFE